jgi:hypothetical protein
MKMAPAQRGGQTRKRDALADTYAQRFPKYKVGFLTAAIYRAMAAALKTGVVPPILVEQSKEIERNIAQHDRRLAAEHRRPFTPRRERQYTARIKNRQIREGDCERPWQNYFDFRAAHPKDVEPLDATDLAYVGQWTACALPQQRRRKRAQRSDGRDRSLRGLRRGVRIIWIESRRR